MLPKYIRGQGITIRSVKDRNYQSKYPEIEEYVGESGRIVESYFIGTSEPFRAGDDISHLSSNCFYRVQLIIQNKLVTIPEEALEPFDSED